MAIAEETLRDCPSRAGKPGADVGALNSTPNSVFTCVFVYSWQRICKCAEKSEISLVHDLPRWRRGGDGSGDERIEALLGNIKRSRDRGTGRNFKGDHDPAFGGLDDPAESAQRQH